MLRAVSRVLERGSESTDRFIPSEAIELFSSEVNSYQKVKERVYQRLAQETEPFVLIGLSLGAALALELSSYDLPNLQALVLSGCPIELAGNIPFYIQLLIFNCCLRGYLRNREQINRFWLEFLRN